MTYELTSEQQAIFDLARRFAIERLKPSAIAWDQQGHFPLNVIRETAALGFGGMFISEELGGAGLSRLDGSLVFEGLSYGCPVIAAFISVHNMCGWIIDRFGSADLRTVWCPRLSSMQTIASYCLTEPNSGSDAAALRTRAQRHGELYVLNGTKAFISGAPVSDLYVSMVRTDGDGPRGISALVVEKGSEGLSFGAPERKMGWRAQPTAMVQFDSCRVPAGNLIGKEGEGFRYAMAALDGGRINIAACSLGAAQSALDLAVDYVKERHAFGRPLADLQSVQFRLADLETELGAARVLLRQAAAKLDARSADATKFCAMAKRFVTDAGFRVANEALQLFGGYGYLADYGVEKIVRDLRVHQILEGTNEIMRVIIARSLLSGGTTRD